MATVKFFQVTALPATLVADAFYFIEDIPNGATEGFLTNNAGVARAIGSSSMINNLIDTKLAAMKAVIDVPLFSDLTGHTENAVIFVHDASGDPLVDSGSALYYYDASDDTYTLQAKYENVTVSAAWADLTDKPTSTVADIDDAVSKRHAHANKTDLDKITKGTGNTLEIDGNPLEIEWTGNDW